MILAVVGTRPEVVKLAPVVHALHRRGAPLELAVSGQHFEPSMMDGLLGSERLQPDHRLACAPGDEASALGAMIAALGALCQRRRPQLVLAVGDTTTVLAAALAARKTGAPFGHIEAGLRCFSRETPEEQHRICADALSDLLFAPTRIAAANLLREQVSGQVLLTGNTILDATLPHRLLPADVGPRRGALVTLHRQENVDRPARLQALLRGLARLAALTGPVEWPMHPRTGARLREVGAEVPAGVTVVGPLPRPEFLSRLQRVRLVITDSGGVQEEAAILGTPCLTVRAHTERPETVAADLGLLCAPQPDAMLAAAQRILSDWARHARPTPALYGDGTAGEQIAAASLAFMAHHEPRRFALRDQDKI